MPQYNNTLFTCNSAANWKRAAAIYHGARSDILNFPPKRTGAISQTNSADLVDMVFRLLSARLLCVRLMKSIIILWSVFVERCALVWKLIRFYKGCVFSMNLRLFYFILCMRMIKCVRMRTYVRYLVCLLYGACSGLQSERLQRFSEGSSNFLFLWIYCIFSGVSFRLFFKIYVYCVFFPKRKAQRDF